MNRMEGKHSLFPEEMEEMDDLNDETFGEGIEWNQEDENIPDFFKEKQPMKLPDFFATQEQEVFEEEPLEPIDGSTKDQIDIFSTQKPYETEDGFFFSEMENKTNSILDDQMESMFNLVIEDEEEDFLRERGIPIQKKKPSQNSSFHMLSPPGINSIWTQQAIEEREKISNVQTPGGENIITKLLGHVQPTNIPEKPRTGISVEELEARLQKTQPASQNLPPQAPMPSQRQEQIQIPQSITPGIKQNWTPVNMSPRLNETLDQQQNRSTPQRNFYRTKWRESKQRMTAHEIDMIIKLQESQIQSGNPYADDYYYNTLGMKKKKGPVVLHRPITEILSTKYVPTKRTDPFEGALGRIPTHSVRAPRALLQLKNETEGSDQNNSSLMSSMSKATYSLLLTIENSFSLLLGIEDIDLVIKHPDSANHFNLTLLYQKREQLTNQLFDSLHVFIAQAPPKETENPLFLYPEDEIFLNFLIVHKGRQAVVRALPLLFQPHVLAIFFVFMRNMSLILALPQMNVADKEVTKDDEHMTKIFGYILSVVSVLPINQIISAFQMLIASHETTKLISLLQSKLGLSVVQAILKRGHDLNLSPFSRDEMHLPPEIQQLSSAGLLWKTAITSLMKKMIGKFIYLFQSENAKTTKIWEFFAVLVVNLNPQEKRNLMNDLRQIISSTPMNPILSAFLQLAGEQPIRSS